MFYRNIKSNATQIENECQHELTVMKKHFETKTAEESSRKITWSDISELYYIEFTYKSSYKYINFSYLGSRAAKKSILIGVILILAHELCGVFVMLNYTASIFAESGSDISPNLSAIVVGFIQLIGTMVATQLIDRAGRKVYYSNKYYTI